MPGREKFHKAFLNGFRCGRWLNRFNDQRKLPGKTPSPPHQPLLCRADHHGNRFGVRIFVTRDFKTADQDGHAQTRQQCEGKFEAVMGVKLQFRQQVATGDAKEIAGAKRERAAEQRPMRSHQRIRAEAEHDRTDRRGQGKQGIQ